MGRPRTATNVLTLRGAFKNHPERMQARENAPEPSAPVGSAPDHLADDEKACWEEVAGYCPAGVLGDCDRTHLEVVAKLLALTRRKPIEEVPDGKIARLAAMLGAMGMNPAERSKVKVPPKAPKNEFEDLDSK